MQVKQPSWFPDKLRHLGQTGKLDLSGESFEDLSFVGSRPSMKQLDLSFTPISTIEGLTFQPKLDTLIADSSELSNFKNFRSVQKVSSVSIKNTPVSHFPTFKLSLLIVIGPSLRVINGQYINQKLREKAKLYPPIAADLVNCGWMVEFPCPDEVELENIKKSFGLAEMEEEDFHESDDSSQAVDFNKTVEYYTSMHKQMIQQAHQHIEEASFDSKVGRQPSKPEQLSIVQEILKDNAHLSLCGKVHLLLQHYGYEIETEYRSQAMLHIISHLLSQTALYDDEEEEEEAEEKQTTEVVDNDEVQDANADSNDNSDNHASDEGEFENQEQELNEIKKNSDVNHIQEDSDSYFSNESDKDFEAYTGNKNDSDLRWEAFIAQIQNED